MAKEGSELEKLRSDDAINELEKISKYEKILGLYDAEAVKRKVRNTQIKETKLEGKIESARMLKELGSVVEGIVKVTGMS